MKSRWSRGLIAAAVSSLLIGGAALADDTATLTVTATVPASCQLTVGPTLAFGTLSMIANTDAQGNIGWVCTNGFNTSIKLGGGTSGNIAARTMGGPGALAYQLYTNAGRTTVFGDGTTGSMVPVSGVGYGTPGTVTVYGRVLQANAATALAGAYTDTVLVTILF